MFGTCSSELLLAESSSLYESKAGGGRELGVEYISSLAAHISTNFPARYTSKQKQAFRAFLLQELAHHGWEAEVVTGGQLLKSHNVVTKNPDADVLLLAHYDTIGRDLLGGLLSRVVGHGLWAQMSTGVIIGLVLVGLGELFHKALAPYLPLPVLLALQLLLPVIVFLPLFIPNKHCLNDNTSGVIALLNIARALNDYPNLRRRVRLALVDLEEVGLVGSRHLRQYLCKQGVDLHDMMIINFDCVGWGQVPVVCPAGKASKARQLWAHLRASRLEVAFNKMPSDHMSFRREGVTAVIFGNPALIGKGFYIPNVHSARDIHLDPQNIAWLTESIVSFCDS